MHDRIEEEVGEHLPVGSRTAVHGQIGLAVDVERQVALSPAWTQAHEHLLGQVTWIKHAPLQVASIRGDLLERLDQFGGSIEIGNQL
jgi:hypothetical protein